jgi:plastocyanin
MPDVTATAEIGQQRATTGWLTWRRLLSATAAADLVAILAFAASRGDPEAAAIAAGFAIGLAMLRWRTGLAGKLLLAVLFADVLGWMALGTITNIGAGEQLGTVLIPATLSGISVSGLIAALVSLRAGAASGAVLAAGLGVTVGVVAAIAALLTPAPVTGTADLQVVSEKVAFDQTTLQAPAGQVIVELANRDLFWHTFTIDELGVDLAVPVGGNQQVNFEADPGIYRFYCRIPGHEARMAGTLTVR